MTALLGLFALSASNDEGIARSLLSRMLPGDDAGIDVRCPSPEALVGVATAGWDEAPARRIATDGRFTCVAHASLYYLDDLSRKLESAGTATPLPGASAAEWILAATRTWSDDAVQRLEGDFAYFVWDARERRVFAARDYSGMRSLFFARIDRGLAVASKMRGVRAVPGCPDTLNWVAIAEDAACLDLAYVGETAYAAIERLPAGFALTWRPGENARVFRWWEIPIFETGDGPPFEEGAQELLKLISQAVLERTDARRGTGVMLSGGYDSTAVYGAGQRALSSEGSKQRLRAVSISHPMGDPGREDELILATTSRWGAVPQWVESESIPAIDDPQERARLRDEPLSHPYELWNRALADACRAVGAGVALNGNGGDLWFSTSPLFLADLFRRGQLLELRKEWKNIVGRFSWYHFFKVAVQPNLSPAMRRLVAGMRGGREVKDPSQRVIPRWIRDDFVARTDLSARRALKPGRRPGEGLSAAEHAWFVQASFPERINALVFGIAQDAGVELRTPLLDSRIARFAAKRPRWESSSGRQNKHLLRRSMRGILPDEIVAPRASRTGLPTTYFTRTVEANTRHASELFTGGMLLAESGVVDHQRVLSAIDSAVSGKMENLDEVVALLFLFQSELWLRGELDEER